MKRKFGAMALALSMGLSLTNGVLAEEQPFDVVGESSPRTFENKDVTIINDNVTDPDKEDDGDEKDTDQTDTSFDFDKDIEDENLKNYLTAMFPKDIDWKTVNYLRISTDNAGENYQELNEFAQKIKNLNGLDKLPNLETLQCYQLTGLKGKTTLKNSSTLSVINIGNCGESTSNTAPESGLDSSPESNTDFSLELSDLPGLEFLTVISNPGLNSLSITGNNEMLTNLTIQNQPKLSVFDPKDLSNLETFYCIGTSIEALTLNTNTKLIDLNCSNSKLKSLDLTSNPSLSTLDCNDNSSLVSLKLNAETNKWLYSLDCSNTQIDSLNLEGFESLHEVKCNDCKELWTATVKNCPELYSFSNTSTPALRNLNVRGCPRLNKKSIARNENLTIEDDPVETKYDYTVKGIEDSYWQTESAIEPKPVLKYGTYTLKEGKDYKLSYKNNVDGPKGSVTITGKGVFGGVNKTVYFKIEKTDRMNRLYNPNSGEHFYTASTAEKNHLVKLGWRSEGIGWTTPKTSKTPVYRLYNPNAGDHHYTMSLAEKDMLVSKGWRYEGIAFYSGDSDGVAVYRPRIIHGFFTKPFFRVLSSKCKQIFLDSVIHIVSGGGGYLIFSKMTGKNWSKSHITSFCA